LRNKSLFKISKIAERERGRWGGGESRRININFKVIKVKLEADRGELNRGGVEKKDDMSRRAGCVEVSVFEISATLNI
jgi:hypothetical protein